MKRFIRNIFVLILFILPISAFCFSITLKGIIGDAIKEFEKNPGNAISTMKDQLNLHEGYIANPRSKYYWS